MSVDTVANAKATPQVQQPWAELGLKADEYESIKQILGRRPTSCELAMYSVMWSEHCSYKSSKVHLARFGQLEKTTPRGPLLAGIGEQAGVVDVGQGWAVTFKAESHNHPSYVEPYQGAATGVGGIVRDILAMGARPVASMDSLRFGKLDAPDTARVLPGIVAGVGGYGNCLGLPNIGGEVVFDDCYYGNPLVNALSVGVLRHEDLHLAFARGTGNKVILYGATTGGDGIGGASVLASETFDADGPAKRPSVQVGDPFMEKLLIECTLELFQAGIINGIQDLGAAGISCATSELASAGDGGMHIDLDLVPLRDNTLTPEEILMSESQERMACVVEPANLGKFFEICAKWEVLATVIGEVTEGDRLIIDWHGETVVDVDPHTVAHEGPVYQRPLTRPAWQDTLIADSTDKLPRPQTGIELADQFLAVVTSPNQADKSWVTDQYDRYVRGNTALAQPQDSGMLRIDEATGLGVALATDANARFTMLDPFVGAELSLCEAYRNVAVTGAEPVAITDCLNFGSPEDPEVMWQFSQAIDGLIKGCQALGTPVTGGNVSFYNRTGEVNIMPTPLVGMLGVIDDVRQRVKAGFRAEGDLIALVGPATPGTGGIDGSAWAQVVHGHLGGKPPQPDYAAEQGLAKLMIQAAKDKLLASAHDLSDGGLAVALAESAILGGLGAQVALAGDDFEELFNERPARALLSFDPEKRDVLTSLANAHGLSLQVIGRVTSIEEISVAGSFSVSLVDLTRAWRNTIPAALGIGGQD
ncbi:MAG: phosphoribosylformylglycinamidine synthase subunit PurL [Propionibacteriaceae bacterium]|jgi:phosphoribosylformylglycinamidine synthase|nr:phosphoribosylformylglycinamidine synthase subunit PurL [Propionibacteriaceae bacterium]